ncbi:hypothetical protein AHAS_Ahas02G0234400 [Arachis hypogaea]
MKTHALLSHVILESLKVFQAKSSFIKLCTLLRFLYTLISILRVLRICQRSLLLKLLSLILLFRPLMLLRILSHMLQFLVLLTDKL